MPRLLAKDMIISETRYVDWKSQKPGDSVACYSSVTDQKGIYVGGEGRTEWVIKLKIKKEEKLNLIKQG